MFIAMMKRTRQLKNNIVPGQYSNFSPNVEKAMQEAYSKYGNTPYWSQFASIPSLNLPSYVNADYVRDNTEDWVTDLYNQYESSALSAINQLYGTIREESYNSAASQVEREKIAGLNPDLLGNVDPGQATEFDDVASKMDIPSKIASESARVQNISSIAQTGLSFFEQFVGLAGQFQQLRNGSLQNSALELGLEGDMNDYVQDFLARRVSTTDDGIFKIDNSPVDFSEVPEKLIEAFSEDVDSMPFSRRTKSLFKRGFRRFSKDSLGVASKIEDLASAFASNRFKRTKLMSSPMWDNDAGKMLSKVIDNFGELDFQITQKQMKVQDLLFDFNMSFYQNANELGVPEKQAALDFQSLDNELQFQQSVDANNLPQKRAEVERGQLDVQSIQNEIGKMREAANKEVEKVFSDILANCQGDKWYHVLGRAIIPFLRFVVTNSVNSYFNSAMSTLGQRTFERPLPPNIRNTYNNTSVYTQ